MKFEQDETVKVVIIGKITDHMGGLENPRFEVTFKDTATYEDRTIWFHERELIAWDKPPQPGEVWQDADGQFFLRSEDDSGWLGFGHDTQWQDIKLKRPITKVWP